MSPHEKRTISKRAVRISPPLEGRGWGGVFDYLILNHFFSLISVEKGLSKGYERADYCL